MPQNLARSWNGKPADSGADRRESPQSRTLSPTALAVLTALPPEIRPTRLSVEFPHVVNKVGELWRQTRQLDAYFDELLEDRRGNRQGFPFSVALEIASLKEYFQTRVRPKKVSIWDGA